MAVPPPRGGGHARRLDAILAHQVKDRAAAHQQIVGNDPAVTTPPHRFGAHDRGRPLVGEARELVEPFGKGIGQRIIGVIVEAAVLPEAIHFRRDVMGAAPKPAEPSDPVVADLPFGERARKRVGIILGVGARARDGAHIDDQLDRAGTKELDELGDRAGRMADGVEGDQRRRASSPECPPASRPPAAPRYRGSDARSSPC